MLRVAYTRFEADKDTMDTLAGLRKKTGTGGREEAMAEGQPPVTSL